MNRPNVFDFTDYRAYLKAFYEWSKGLGSFSHGVFAERAGLKSRSYLRLVLTGKRNLSPHAVSQFIQGLGIRGHEADGFTALVHFNQASDFDSRKYYWESFLKVRPKDKKGQRIKDEYSYLARMNYPSLLVLLRQNHVPHDIKTLSHLTGMTPAQTDEGIQTLVNLGLVRKSEDGFFVSDSLVETTDDVPSIAVDTFHRNMMKAAQERADLPKNEREFQSVLVPLTHEEFMYIKARLRDLACELDEKFSGVRPKSQRVYAVNLNIIPLTPLFIRGEQKISSQNGVAVAESQGVQNESII